MSGFIHGDYKQVIKKLHRPKIDIFRQDLEVFLLDFYPYDESSLFRHYKEEDTSSSNGEEQRDYESDQEPGDDESSEEEEKKDQNGFRVRLFGIINYQDRGYSISLDLTGYQPFFFIKVPDHWTSPELEQLVFHLKEEARKDPNARYYSDTLIKSELLDSKPFYGYTANDKFKYAKLIFRNSSGFSNYRNLLETLRESGSSFWKHHQLFESNIEPMLRLLHIREITPSGWVRIPRSTAKISDLDTSDCSFHYELSNADLVPVPDRIEIPKIEVASFDIECDSSHGDFPIAAKNTQKLAQDFITEYLKLPSQQNSHYLRAVIYTWLCLAFNPYYDNNNINPVTTENNQSPDEESINFLVPVIKELGENYHQSVQSIIAAGLEPQSVRGYQEHYIAKLQHHLEFNLPPLDLERPRVGNYKLLAEQLIKEVHRMLKCHNARYLQDPEGMIRFWLEKLAFHPFYDNHNISYVYTKGPSTPSQTLLSNLVPQVYAICRECYQLLNKPKQKKKSQPKIGPKKFMSLPPTSKGQTRLSQSKFVKQSGQQQQQKKSGQQPKSAVARTEQQRSISQKRKSDKNQPTENQFFRGRYIKPKPVPDENGKVETIGRDFYVKWLHELFDQFLPEVVGDPVIQIGTTFKRYGEKELYLKHIITLHGCSEFTNDQLVDDENRDIFITKPKDALEQAAKLKLDTPLIKKIQDRLDKAEEDGEKKPNIPELKELNNLLYLARRDRQLNGDRAVLRVECYQTEREVLLAWRRLIKETDPDIITGYNIFGFDFKYLWDRAEVLGIIEEFRDLGRLKRYPERLIEKKLQSSGLGDNLLYYIQMTGRVLVDLLKVVQSGGYRLPIYKLDFVCNHFLYKRKNDLPPQQIFILQKGSDQDRATIARYCLIDCILCNRLIDKLEIITNNIGMSRVCKVPLSYLFLRGQGVKILSLVSDITRKEGYLIQAKERNPKQGDDWYEGAIVLDPAKGIYFESSVVADFNSLYPSCMIAWNLSHDSYIEIGGKYDNLPKDQYHDVQYDLYREELVPGRKSTHKVKYGVKTCRFYQPPDGSKNMLPRILQRLLKARKDTRNEQKDYPKGSFEWNVKEGLQLAYKVTANSLYGQVGAKTSAINLKDIAACTTACGRGLIYQSKKFFEENYKGAQTIYGDSVTGDTPILVRGQDGMVDVKTIETLHQSEYMAYPQFKSDDIDRIDKEQSTTNYQVWTDKGWAEIRRVIRHRTNKKIYQINSYKGCINVTEDHSLIDVNYNLIKPTECLSPVHIKNNEQEIKDIKEATNLLYSFPDEFVEFGSNVPQVGKLSIPDDIDKSFICGKCNKTRPSSGYYYIKKTGKRTKPCKYCIKEKQCETKGIKFNGKLNKTKSNTVVGSHKLSREEAWVWGFFMADGSCGRYGEKEKVKNSWAINNNNMERLEKALNYLNSVEPIRFKILDTLKSSGVYKLVPLVDLNYMVVKYRKLFYDKDKYKVVPKIILNATREIRESFFEGYYEGDGSKTGSYSLEKRRISFACKGKIGAMGLYYLCKSLDFKDISVNTQFGKHNIYTIYSLKTQKYQNKIRRIIEYPETDNYVYDLETTIGRFHAGVGETIVKNTDSVRMMTETGDVIPGNRNILYNVQSSSPPENRATQISSGFLVLSGRQTTGVKEARQVKTVKISCLFINETRPSVGVIGKLVTMSIAIDWVTCRSPNFILVARCTVSPPGDRVRW